MFLFCLKQWPTHADVAAVRNIQGFTILMINVDADDVDHDNGGEGGGGRGVTRLTTIIGLHV